MYCLFSLFTNWLINSNLLLSFLLGIRYWSYSDHSPKEVQGVPPPLNAVMSQEHFRE